MRSLTTRHVLRCLRVAHRGPVPPSPLLYRPIFRTYPVGCRVPRVQQLQQRRTLFNVFQKPPRTLKELETEPGYDLFLKFRANENDNIRQPPRSQLVKAWRDFFSHKAKYGRRVNATQALCAHRVLEYLCQPDPTSVQLSEDDLRLARDCLSSIPRDEPADHLILVKLLYTESRRRALNIALHVPLYYMADRMQAKHKVADFYQLLATMAHHGEALEARDLLLESHKNRAVEKGAASRSRSTWVPVLHGLAREGREQELLEFLAFAESVGLEYSSLVHGIMSIFYAHKDDFKNTQYWFDRRIHNDDAPTRHTYYEILKFAVRNKRLDWAESVHLGLLHRLERGSWRQLKACWDASFCFAVMLQGKGADHLEHMFRVSLEQTKDLPNSQPTINSINALLRVAIDMKDSYLAERLMTLSEKLGFEPNVHTYLLQIEYRLNANDLDGAYAAFRAMPDGETGAMLPVLNELIRALCKPLNAKHERVLDVTSYLEELRAVLEPETVVAVCMAFLRNDEHYEVIDTLSLHTAHYSIRERQTVRKAFTDYCLDTKNSTARVWDAYALLRQFFPETETEYRLAIMDGFFDRRRADMACHVFGHMRAHDNPAHRPNGAGYVRFFEGIGRSPDPESLRAAHNMLKMDTAVTPDTAVWNGLMLGYAACGESLAYRALEFFREVTASAEGPSYQSLEIFFRACERTPFGDGPARDLWAKMLRMDIDVPPPVYSSYVGALTAHNGHSDEVRKLLEDMEATVGQRPGLHTLAIVYDALQSNEQKEQFEAWAREEYPPTWEKLAKRRRRPDQDGLLKFNVPRPWKA